MDKTEGTRQVRLAVLGLDGKIFGYKIDSCWSLSPKGNRYKTHPFRDAKPDGHLADNLKHCFEKTAEGTADTKDSWFRRFPEGVIVSVEDVSPENFGKELMRYRIVRKCEYIIKSD